MKLHFIEASRTHRTLSCLVAAAILLGGIPALTFAATNWDSNLTSEDGEPVGNGTKWWFDPVNWSTTNIGDVAPFYLPPGNDTGALTDIQFNSGFDPGGEGVVYDPSANDPNFAATGNSVAYPFPAGYGAQSFWRIYISRNTTSHNLLTIRGDMTVSPDASAGAAAFVVGRSGSSVSNQNLGRVNHEAGKLTYLTGDLDIGNREASGWGNGIYDYRGGILEHGLSGGRFRLSAGGSAGTGGHGRLIVHNPTTPGYIRTRDLQIASHGGQNNINPDGITTGVGIVEFHYANGGTRPVQVTENLALNNGSDNLVAPDPADWRSARLQMVLDEAPALKMPGVPVDLGLFDVDFGDAGFGLITGAGHYGTTFSNALAANPLSADAVFNEGGTVSANFGTKKYNWSISYTGNITWDNPDISDVGTITGPGTGTDIVLMGLSIEDLPGFAGDFNEDGKVDAADYTVWRNNLNTNNALPNDNGLNVPIGQAHYNLWKTNFGTGGPGAGAIGAGAVPEPSTMLTAVLCVAGVLGLRWRAA